ncbi:RHS repeat-associated core domain-containing protein [Limihaloglobus sulfuriphilus]|nr:RHS repeat-associated core domain-containing protein [Limihaloglobus sulfuriphilus]
MTNINGSTWTAGYNYTKDGNVSCQTGSNASLYSFTGDLMTDLNSNTLTWDDNGRLTGGINDSFTYNLDGRLKTGGTVPTDYIDLAYDPMNNRVYKKSVVPGQGESSVTTETQYIVDIVGGLPTILCEFDLDNSSLTYSYIYADSQVLCQLKHDKYLDEYDDDGDNSYEDYIITLEDRLFYLHDRLGSIREVVDFADINPVDGIEDSPVVVAGYTYNPFGEDFSSECFENTGIHNPFKYTGQWYDDEIDQYYLRARMYDPQMMRFTGRDPVRGKYGEPLTLHRYLYTANEPINRIDPNGKIFGAIWGMGMRAKDAAVGVGVKAWAAMKINAFGATVNALISGGVNAATGPSNLSWETKFAIGASAGFIEYNIAQKAGLGVAGSIAGAYTASLNTYFSNGSFKSKRFLTEIGMSVVAGGLGTVADNFVEEGSQVIVPGLIEQFTSPEKITAWTFSFDRQFITGMIGGIFGDYVDQ